MHVRFSFLLIALVGLNACVRAQSKQAEFYHMLTDMYEQTVPLIMADDLARKGLENYVVLDTREAEEYEVCHLNGATWVGYDQFQKKIVQDFPKDQPIVVYCSVGYRSERIGEKLQNMGFTKVYNLYGGIFDWKNRDHEVIDAEGNSTEKVHTYNRKWGQWLLKGEKIY